MGRSRNDVVVALVLLALALVAGATLFGYLGYRVYAARRPVARAAVPAPQESVESPTAMPSATPTATLPAIAASMPTLARFVGAPATPLPPTATLVPPALAPTVRALGGMLQTPPSGDGPEADAASPDEDPGELPGEPEATETPEEEPTPELSGGARSPSSRGGDTAGRLPQTGAGLALPLGGTLLAGLAAATNLLRRQRRSTSKPPSTRNGA